MKETADSLREWLDRLKDCFEQIDQPAEARIAGALASSVDSERPVKIVIVGEFNSGKSTLVNALCGINVLPAGIIPTTATINIVEYSPTPHIAAFYVDGSRTDLPFAPDTLQQFTARNGDQKNLREVRISVPNLPSGLFLIDTPGVNDINHTRSEIVYGMIPEADVVVFLMDVQQPLKRSEVDFLRNRILGTSIVKTIFVLNHTDRVSDPRELTGAVDYVRKGLKSIYTEIADCLAHAGAEQLASELRRADIPIFTISAKRMLRSSAVGARVEGDPEGLKSALWRLVSPEAKMQTVLNGIAIQTVGLIARLRQNVDERIKVQGTDREHALTEVRKNTKILRQTLEATRQALSRIESQRKVLRGEAERAIDCVFRDASATVAARLESVGTEKGLQIIQQEIGRTLESRISVLNEHIQQLALESTRQTAASIPVSASGPNLKAGATCEQHHGWLADVINDPVKGPAFWVLANAAPFLFGPIGLIVLALPFVTHLFSGTSNSTSVEQIRSQISKSCEEIKTRVCAAVDERLDTIAQSVLNVFVDLQQRVRSGCSLLNGEKGISRRTLDYLRSQAIGMDSECFQVMNSLSTERLGSLPSVRSGLAEDSIGLPLNTA
jgi:GTPase SAR1 family protein